MQRACQFAAWLLALAIVILSLAPASVRPLTGVGHGFEHLLIFLATGMAFALGYAVRASVLMIALVMFAGAIEVAQIWAPGRHARSLDFIVDGTASCLGVALACVLLRIRAAMQWR